MRFQRKREAIALVLLVVIAFMSIQVKTTESPDPFFTLVAKCYTPTQMDILFMLKQQLVPIYINLDIILMDWDHLFQPDPDLASIVDYDLAIIEFNNETNIGYHDLLGTDPYFTDLYSENGSIVTLGYESSYDWDEELGIGRNEWYIQNGKQMISNGSLNQKEFCWEWQYYLMAEILPCLPLFAHKNDNSSLQLLVFNLREERPILGNRAPCPGYPTKSIGLTVKKAISYAINREEIKRVALGDDYEIIHHPINPTNKSWLNPNIFKYCHNKQIANNYIDYAGYAIGWNPYWGEYDDWPDWEDVCSPGTPTIDVNGFGLEIAAFCLIICSISFLTYLKKRKK